jgi:hypothetical protein
MRCKYTDLLRYGKSSVPHPTVQGGISFYRGRGAFLTAYARFTDAERVRLVKGLDKGGRALAACSPDD